MSNRRQSSKTDEQILVKMKKVVEQDGGIRQFGLTFLSVFLDIDCQFPIPVHSFVYGVIDTFQHGSPLFVTSKKMIDDIKRS